MFGSLQGAGFGSKYFGEPGDRENNGQLVASTVAAAIVGGTVSELSGGKFANGAATATMVHVFNLWGKKKEKEEIYGPLIDDLKEMLKDVKEGGTLEIEMVKLFGTVMTEDADLEALKKLPNARITIERIDGDTVRGKFIYVGGKHPVRIGKVSLAQTVSGHFALTSMEFRMSNIQGLHGHKAWFEKGLMTLWFPRFGEYDFETYDLEDHEKHKLVD